MSRLRFKISMSLDGFVAGPTRAWRIRSELVEGAFTSGPFSLQCFVRSWP